MRIRLAWTGLLALTLGTSQVHGQYEAAEDDPSPYSDATLISESAWVAPGTPFTVGLKLTMDEGWHSYWVNPGDVGEPIVLTWDLPEGFTAAPIQWPYPEKIDAQPLRSYGFSGEALFLVDITPPAAIDAESVTLATTANWLICEDVCLFAEESVSLVMAVQEGTPGPSASAQEFTTARERVPLVDAAWDVAATKYSRSLALSVTPPEGASTKLEGAYFFPEHLLLLEHAVDQPMSIEGDAFVFALQESEYATEVPGRLLGVLVAREGEFFDAGGTKRALAIDVPLEVLQAVPEEETSALPLMLVFALIGGLLLNLMPCVFPVLSIKVLGFAQQKALGSRTQRLHGLSFAGGVVVSFLVLAGLLLVLRAAGNQIGWGFQLQSPLFVAGMAFLFFAIGLNLFGVFDIRGFTFSKSGTSGHSFARSWSDGALATLIATPCTAPFMGAALGAAVALPPVEGLLIFLFLGLGMAAPYVTLSMVPGLLAKLPKPGAWMETLKHVLAFPMLGTTVWLVWVFGNQVGVNGLGLLLVGLLLFAAATWILGRWPALSVSPRVRMATRTIAVLVAGLGLISAYQGTQASAGEQTEVSSDALWVPFVADQIAELNSEGQAVFVDFTAAWCLTCQVNKTTTLSSSSVVAAFEQKGVVLMRADWTNRDPDITRALESHGRSGVPLYVLYTGNNESPVLLPEVLTESIVMDALAPLPDQAEVLTLTD